MSIFYKEDATRPTPRKVGRNTSIRGPDPIVLKPIVSRDALIDQHVAAMGAGGNGHLQIGERLGPQTARTGKMCTEQTSLRNGSGPLWGQFPPDAPPKMRIRIGVSDDELRKIWHEDDTKGQVATKMESSPTMIEKMMEYDYPMKHPAGEHLSKKRVTAIPKAPVDGNDPEGFSGMGKFSDAPKPRGRKSHEVPLPEIRFKVKPHGRRHPTRPEDEFALGFGKVAEFRKADPIPEERGGLMKLA